MANAGADADGRKTAAQASVKPVHKYVVRDAVKADVVAYYRHYPLLGVSGVVGRGYLDHPSYIASARTLGRRPPVNRSMRGVGFLPDHFGDGFYAPNVVGAALQDFAHFGVGWQQPARDPMRLLASDEFGYGSLTVAQLHSTNRKASSKTSARSERLLMILICAYPEIAAPSDNALSPCRQRSAKWNSQLADTDAGAPGESSLYSGATFQDANTVI